MIRVVYLFIVFNMMGRVAELFGTSIPWSENYRAYYNLGKVYVFSPEDINCRCIWTNPTKEQINDKLM